MSTSSAFASNCSIRYKLTEPELRLWVEYLKQPQDPCYNIVFAFKIVGAYELQRVESSLQKMTNCCYNLRTRFINTPDGPCKEILKHQDIELEVCDIKLEYKKKIILNRILSKVALTPFDIETEPPSRYLAIILENNEFVFVTAWHHIITDGYTVKTNLDIFSRAYNNEDLGVGRNHPYSTMTVNSKEYEQQGLCFWKEVINEACFS